MSFIAGFITGIIIGGAVGIMTTCACTISKRADKRMNNIKESNK